MIYDGTAGNDTNLGSSANDTLSGLAGDDFLSGGAGHDRILGGDGADTLVGGAGNDTLDGGSGGWLDTLQYLGDGATAGATVNLALGTATDGYGGHDTLIGFENVMGGDFADNLIGDDAVNYLDGQGGNDTIRGGGGADILGGEGGNDSIDGEAGADTLFGGVGDDILRGGTGDDVLLGANGNDTLDGGVQDWQDIADYYEAPFAVVVNLAQGVATLDGFANTDTLISIEGVYGSAFADRITGDANGNFLWAAGGDDTLEGGGGNDTLEGAEGNDLALFSGSASSYTITSNALTGQMTVSGPDGTDILNGIEHLQFGGVPWSPQAQGTPQDDVISGSDAADTIHGAQGNDNVSGGAGADALYGDEGADTLTGGAGNDNIDGGAGLDTAVFASARAQYALTQAGAGYTVRALQGSDGTDTLAGIERLQFADTHIALDIQGNAGIAARIIGAVAGAEWIGHAGAGWVGSGLALLDGGATYASVMQAALDLRLGANASHGAVVDLLYTNIMHAPPQAAMRAYFVELLDNHTYTPVGLAMAAADTAQNADNIGLTGLAATGLEYL